MVDFDFNKFGSMKDWHNYLEKENVTSMIIHSEDKLEELERLKESGLPHPQFKIFDSKISKKEVDNFFKKYGRFWINFCPLNQNSNLQRRHKLNLSSFEEIINAADDFKINLSEYCTVLMQYPQKVDFCGTAIFNGSEGVIEFIPEELHHKLARGVYTPDVAIVKNGEFEKYSSRIHISMQRAFLKLILGKKGYFEFVKGIMDDEEGFFFFSIKYDDTHLNYFKD